MCAMSQKCNIGPISFQRNCQQWDMHGVYWQFIALFNPDEQRAYLQQDSTKHWTQL